MTPENLSILVGTTYEAAGDSAAWHEVVKLLAKEFETPIVGLDLEATAPSFDRDTAASVNFDSNLLDTYLEEFRTPDVNIGMRMLVSAPVGRAFNMWSHMDRETYETEASTVAILKPQRIDKALMVRFGHSLDKFGFLSLYRQASNDEFNASHQRQLTLVAHHIQRSQHLAAKLSEHVTFKQQSHDSLKNASTIHGMIVVGKDYSISSVDAGATIVLSNCYGLVERKGGLCSNSREAGQTTADLRAYIRQHLAGSAPFFVTDRKNYATTIQVYPGYIKSTAAGIDNFLRIEVTTTLLQVNSGLDRLAAIYGLTKAESRVVSALTQAKNATEAAQKLGIARETMKSHLENIYPKVGARSINHLMFIAGRFAKSSDP
jgi:DNA-binding CsgD family transcriptional regulator